MRVKRISLALVVLVVIGVALGFGLRTPRPSAVLPDGTVLQITGVKVGYTNEFRHGSRLEKILGDWIPTNGWKFGRWELQRPEVVRRGSKASTQMVSWRVTGESNRVLTIQFQLTGESNLVSNSDLLPRFLPMPRALDLRVVHWGEDRYRYVDWVLDGFSKRRGGYFGYVDVKSYARGSERLYLKIQRWQEKKWNTIASFEFENPARTEVESWTTASYPVANVYGDFSAVLGPVQVQELRDDTRHQDALHVPFKFSLNGRSVTNWRVEEMEVYDASGNYETNEWLEIESVHTNGWTMMRAWRSANPHVPWRMKGHFTEWREFAASNLFQVELPVSSEGVITNFFGWPVMVGRFGHRIEIRLLHEPPWRRVVLVDIVGENGGSLKESAWRSNQWEFYGNARSAGVGAGGDEVTVIGAIVQDIPFEFTVQPRLVREVEWPGEER